MKQFWDKIVAVGGSNVGLKALALIIAVGLWVAGHRDTERAIEVPCVAGASAIARCPNPRVRERADDRPPRVPRASQLRTWDWRRDIGQELFITLKTVETHLSSVYRKLGIRSRHELCGRLGADD